MINEVIFYSYGDSNDVSTWSNVPYLFTKTLEEKGIKVDRVDLRESTLVKYVCKGSYRLMEILFLRRLYPGNDYGFTRSRFYRWYANRAIKKSVRKYPHADLCIFTNFDFTNKFSAIPTLLFCDWTYKIYILDRLQRQPYRFEKNFAEHQAEVINSSEYVVSLFPVCADQMKKDYPNANVHYLGGNVINSLFDRKLGEDEIIATKRQSQSILFIGNSCNPKYVEAANMLVQSFEKVCERYPGAELHFIGMKAGDLARTKHPCIHFHGYLHKDIESERDTYYKLLISSRMIVNPSPLWGGYSSTIEAMYFYTPVIVAPYKDFVKEFGDDIDFGLYNREYDADTLSANIYRMLASENYPEMCRAAHQRVRSYTWSAYVDRLLDLVSK